MKIDLHVHTSDRSPCGASTIDEQICAAIDAGLDAIVVSDHDRLAPQNELARLNDTYAPFRIVGGIEISLNVEWSMEHILVVGVHDEGLEHMRWTYSELSPFVRQNGGFMALAHPFRFHDAIQFDIEGFPPDAIEAYSNNTPGDQEQRILKLADRLGMQVLSNSDAHHTKFLGRYYNELQRTPADDQELVEILKAGEFECVKPVLPHR